MAFDQLWPLLKPALIAVWIGYLVVLAGWIVLQKREPIATLSWLLSLALLPVLGLVIYHFLGPQRIAHARAGLVGFEDVVLHVQVVACLGDGLQQRVEGGAAAHQQLQPRGGAGRVARG